MGGGAGLASGGPRPGAPANACAPWPPAVTEHRGTPGQRLLRRGGEGRQAPAGGRPTCHRGRGAEPGLPGLRGEPPAGPVPAWGPLLGQRPPGRPLAQQGRRWRALAAACCEFCPCLPGPQRPPPCSVGTGASRTPARGPRLREQGHAGSGGPAGARASRLPPLRPVNHVRSSSRKGATALPASRAAFEIVTSVHKSPL